jgi:hypothetical protein
MSTGAQTTIDLVPEVRCANCWHTFRPEDALFIASHEDLMGDPRLVDAEERRRFLPTRFRPDGAAVDEKGRDCRDLACPSCHLLVPRVLLERRPTLFLSIFGRPAAGKSYALTSMMRQLKRVMPQRFGLGFTEPHPQSNRLVQGFENSLFNHPDPEAMVDIPRTASSGTGARLWYQAVRSGSDEILYPRPMYFQVAPMPHHPHGADAARYARTLCLYDNAGEDFTAGRNDSPNSPVTQHMARSAGLFFVFDPMQEPAFLRACRGKSADPQIEMYMKDSRDPQSTILNNADQNVKKFLQRPIAEPLDTPLVVIVAKHDAWGHLLGGDLPDFFIEPQGQRAEKPGTRTLGQPPTVGGLRVSAVEEVSQRIHALLLEHDPTLVAAAQRFSRNVYFVPASATGCSPTAVEDPETGHRVLKFRAGSIAPYWIELPLIWMLARHVPGLVPVEKRAPTA